MENSQGPKEVFIPVLLAEFLYSLVLYSFVCYNPEMFLQIFLILPFSKWVWFKTITLQQITHFGLTHSPRIWDSWIYRSCPYDVQWVQTKPSSLYQSSNCLNRPIF